MLLSRCCCSCWQAADENSKIEKLADKVEQVQKKVTGTFETIVQSMAEALQVEHWGVTVEKDGPRAIGELCDGIVEAGGGDPISMDTNWAKESGVPDNRRARRQHKVLSESTHVGALQDKLNLTALYCFDKLSKRRRWISNSRSART